VLDPLAVVLLLASQYSFQRFREQLYAEGDSPLGPIVDVVSPEPTVTEQPKVDVIPEVVTDFEGVREPNGEWIQTGPDFDKVTADDTSYVVKQPLFRNRVFKKPQEGYIQNEEQANSNLWAKTTGKE
jgi:hypothetical protein